MIRIVPIQLSDWDRVAHLTVSEPQRAFVSTMAELYDIAAPDFHFHAIEADGVVVGFFNLDIAYGERYDFAEPGELGLRSFLIDGAQQGRGYGKAACLALVSYLQRHYPSHPAIVLTVNCRNPGAYKAYRSAGFDDTGELYHGGAAGPQHIMRMTLA